LTSKRNDYPPRGENGILRTSRFSREKERKNRITKRDLEQFNDKLFDVRQKNTSGIRNDNNGE